jgi:large subunit ribosomal protein L18
MYAQLINDDEGETLVAASSLELGLEDKPQTEQAKTVGEKIGERAQDNNIDKVVFDKGGYDYGGRVEALADAARSAGLDF